jgi:hypothetical protein
MYDFVIIPIGVHSCISIEERMNMAETSGVDTRTGHDQLHDDKRDLPVRLDGEDGELSPKPVITFHAFIGERANPSHIIGPEALVKSLEDALKAYHEAQLAENPNAHIDHHPLLGVDDIPGITVEKGEGYAVTSIMGIPVGEIEFYHGSED